MSTLRKKMIQQMQLKGYSERTIATYLQSINAIANHYHLSPDLISVEQIRDFIHYNLQVKKLSKVWMNQTVSALKVLFCQVLKREWNSLDIPRPRRELKLPVVLSRQEITRLLNATTNLKHRAFLMITYSAGLRMGETRSLKLADIDSKRMLIRVVQAKGNKDRYTILSPVTLDLLRLYWQMYHPNVWLFENSAHQPLADRTLQYMFKSVLSKSGIKKDIGIHALRHSFATHLLEQGVSLPIIQQLLGHTSLRTTSIYLHVQQYSVYAVKSPLDSITL